MHHNPPLQQQYHYALVQQVHYKTAVHQRLVQQHPQQQLVHKGYLLQRSWSAMTALS
jgi:hypothetical protein